MRDGIDEFCSIPLFLKMKYKDIIVSAVLELSPGGTSFVNEDGSPLTQNTNEQSRNVNSERTRTVLELSPGGTTFTEGMESVEGTQSPLDACKFGKAFPLFVSESAMDGSSKKSKTKLLHKGVWGNNLNLRYFQEKK